MNTVDVFGSRLVVIMLQIEGILSMSSICIAEDGHFMICRDHCNEWYHGDSVGITPHIGQEMKDDNKEYTCPSCTSDTTFKD